MLSYFPVEKNKAQLLNRFFFMSVKHSDFVYKMFSTKTSNFAMQLIAN